MLLYMSEASQVALVVKSLPASTGKNRKIINKIIFLQKSKWMQENIPCSVQFSRSVVSDSATPWIAACQASLSITNSWSLTQAHVHQVGATAGYCFCFGSIPSFFLELFLHWSPVAYWVLTDLGSSSFSILSFCLFILFMGFSRQEYWSALPFPSPVDHILSDLSTMTRPSWVAPHGMA